MTISLFKLIFFVTVVIFISDNKKPDTSTCGVCTSLLLFVMESAIEFHGLSIVEVNQDSKLIFLVSYYYVSFKKRIYYVNITDIFA